MKFSFEIFLTISSVSWIAESATNFIYMDPMNRRYQKPSTGSNLCNPLYWYPRSIPSYCYKSNVVKPSPKPLPPPLPFPPIPMPIPMPMPMPYSVPSVPAYPPLVYSAVPQYVPPPPLMLPLPAQMPFGMPSPGFGMPPAQSYYPPAFPPAFPPPQQAGLVPGVPGIVSPDGGINILPFSDVYSDMLEKHKQKQIRKRLEKVLDEYDNYPKKKQNYRRYRIGVKNYK